MAAGRSVLQDWTSNLSFMQQSVLIASVRGPDGIRKDHPVKVLCRYLRRSFLLSAFTGTPILNPYDPGGGSFTGPCTLDWEGVKYGDPKGPGIQGGLEKALDLYLRSVDELPHHFQLHFMHAAEILGYKHPDEVTRSWWLTCYLRLVNDAHLFPESEELMDKRLGDIEKNWRAREEVTAL